MSCLLQLCIISASFLSNTVLSCENTFNSVTTPSGIIEGKTDIYNGIPVRAFLGIPYAKPPVGELRFKKPVPFGSWDTALQAKYLPPGCTQFSTNPFTWLDNQPGLSTDCLYLNIWTPPTASIDNKKSVMFWLHGGAFLIGSSRLDFYNGKALAVEGDVIVVTTNYRLGVEGFFNTGTEDAPGNMGIWDMVEALKWVKNNIQYFGGDAKSVTIFGQSAGAVAAGLMTMSSITKGLFKRLILQSGSPLQIQDEDRSFEISQQVALAVGCAEDINTLKEDPKTVMECLQEKDAVELAETLANVTANSSRFYYVRFGDSLTPTNPRQAIRDGHFFPVDVLIGTNDGDGATLITKSKKYKDIFGFFGEKNPQINYTYGKSIIRDNFQNYPNPESVVQQYLGLVEDDDYDNIRFQVFTASGDFFRICLSNFYAESFAKKHASVYYYFFTHRPSYTPWAPWMRAVHHEETPLVFGYPLRYPQLYTLDEHFLSRRIIEDWSTFAKYGIAADGDWPKYSKEHPAYKVLDVSNSFSKGFGPHQGNCEFFRSHFGF